MNWFLYFERAMYDSCKYLHRSRISWKGMLHHKVFTRRFRLAGSHEEGTLYIKLGKQYQVFRVICHDYIHLPRTITTPKFKFLLKAPYNRIFQEFRIRSSTRQIAACSCPMGLLRYINGFSVYINYSRDRVNVYPK